MREEIRYGIIKGKLYREIIISVLNGRVPQRWIPLEAFSESEHGEFRKNVH